MCIVLRMALRTCSIAVYACASLKVMLLGGSLNFPSYTPTAGRSILPYIMMSSHCAHSLSIYLYSYYLVELDVCSQTPLAAGVWSSWNTELLRVPHGDGHIGVDGRRFAMSEKSAARISTFTGKDTMFFMCVWTAYNTYTRSWISYIASLLWAFFS